MSKRSRRPPSLFAAIVLILFGLLLLAHSFRESFGVWEIFKRWWPALLILWGLVRLVEHLTEKPAGTEARPAIRGGEILLILVLLAFVGTMAGVEWLRSHARDARIPMVLGTNSYTYGINVAPRTLPPDARVTVRTTDGDIMIRAEDAAQLQVTAKKVVGAWDEKEAQQLAAPVTLAIEQTAAGFDVHPQGQARNERVGVDIDARVPRHAVLTVRDEHGDIQVTGMDAALEVHSERGDVEVRDSADVTAEMNRGDLKVTNTKGDVRISGRGDDVEVVDAAGMMTVNGDFSGSIRAEKIAKGLHLVSPRADLSIARLSGHLDCDLEDLELQGASGNVSLRSDAKDVTVENVAGRVQIENRAGSVELRFAQPPEHDISVTNDSSGITLLLPSKSTFEIQADSRSGRIESDFSGEDLKLANDNQGNAHLGGRVGARGPKIILKTTYGTIAIRKSS
jgi:DUF4097 and DUF4098 domain-containing protein YvlB